MERIEKEEKEQKEWTVKFTDEAKEQFDELPNDGQEEIKKFIEKVRKEGPPKNAEPMKPCFNCDEYFFHSFGFCPYCGFRAPSG
jgi:vacuolar-type H+-ATPase subunit H